MNYKPHIPIVSIITFSMMAVLFVGAVIVQSVSTLPSQYTWIRTLELLWSAMTDSYFIVMAFIFLAAAKLRNRHQVSHAVIRSKLHLVLAIVLTTCIAIALLVSTNKYTISDYLSFIPAAALLVDSLNNRHLGHALLGILFGVLVLVIVSYIYTITKSQLFVYNQSLDVRLINLEKTVFGQSLYVEIARWSQEHPMIVYLCDWIYFLHLHYLILLALFLFACGEFLEQLNYLTSVSLVYLIGGFSYYIYPALGPVFYDPSVFAYLAKLGTLSYFIQNMLLQSTQQAKAGQLEVIQTYIFIACMPSLHLTHQSIILYYSRSSTITLLVSILYWLLTFLSVLVLGWHYLLDSIAGIFLAILILGFVHWCNSNRLKA